MLAVYHQRAAVGLDLAEQDACEFQLTASHEAVDAEHFAGARLERDVLQAAGQRQPVGLQHRRTIGRWRQRDIVRIGLLQRLAALADHRFDQGGLAGRGGCGLGDLPAVAEHRHGVGDAQDVLDEMRDEDDAGAFVAQPPQGRKQALDLGRRQRRGRLVEDDDAGTREQDAGDLDQLLQADRQITEPRHRIDVDAEPCELLAGFARHAPPLHQAEAIGRLGAKEDVFGHRQVGSDAELLVDHGDAGRVRVARRPETGFLSVQHKATGEFRMHAGDDLHQRAFSRAVFADETMDLAGIQREIDPTKSFDAAEALRDLN